MGRLLGWRVAGAAVWLLLVLCLALSRAHAQEPVPLPDRVTISTGEVRPTGSRVLPGKGAVPTLVTEAFANVGIDVTFRFLSWTRAYEMASRGQVDATAHWVWSEERQRLHHYSDPLFPRVTCFFHLTSTDVPDWQNLSDLRGLRIGAVRGEPNSREFLDLIDAGVLRVEFVDDPVLNYRKLFAGQLDLVVEDEEVGYDLATTHFSPEEARRLTHARKPLTVRPVFLLFPKSDPKSPALRDRFNDGLARLKATGRLREIFAQGNVVSMR